MNIDPSIDLDELVSVGLDPQTWYRFVQLQVDLLRSHIQELEERIAESIRVYRREKIIIDSIDVDEGHSLVILEEHRGVESTPNDLEEIFEYYFPNLQRRSTLVILFSFFERQLDQLCELFGKAQRLNICHTDLKATGIDRSRRYLQKVIGLQLVDNSHSWQELKKIRKVRNAVVHNDARLFESDIKNYVAQTDYLSPESRPHYDGDIDEVNILEGYLNYVVDTFVSYCDEVNKAIENQVLK
jgi:hypothetical protein